MPVARLGWGLSSKADRASRVTIGHPRGIPLAFGNVYADVAELIRARREERAPDPLALRYPSAGNRRHSLRVIRAAVEPAGARVDVQRAYFHRILGCRTASRSR